MKNLENYGVQELNTIEIKKTDGGFWNYVIGAIIAYGWEVANNPQAHSDALQSGYDSYESPFNN